MHVKDLHTEVDVDNGTDVSLACFPLQVQDYSAAAFRRGHVISLVAGWSDFNVLAAML